MDKDTTLAEIKRITDKFRQDRDWGQFHDAKNLAEAISIEASELQELFLWRKVEDVEEKIKSDPNFKEKVEEEFADVMIFLMHFASTANIDVASAVKDKTEKNEKKYPVEKAKGKADKYTEL